MRNVLIVGAHYDDTELGVRVGRSQKFSERLLKIPKYMCIGEHPSPLPKGRGAACINWAILTGEKRWGDTFFQMTGEYDKGVILAQNFFDIKDYDNVKTVYDKVEYSSRKIIKEQIDYWSNGLFETKVQQEENATYYKRRKPSDGFFNFLESAEKIHDFIRAQTYPYPGAFFFYNNKKVTVLSSKVHKGIITKANVGEAAMLSGNGGVIFKCGDESYIELCRVRQEMSSEMWAEDWLDIAGAKNT